MLKKRWLNAALALACYPVTGVVAADIYDGSLKSFENFIVQHEEQLKGWDPPSELSVKMELDDATLRYARWDSDPNKSHQGTVVYFSGRTEFIERDTQTYSDLARMGWDVWAFDWRGQGWSTRPLPGEGAIRGHIESFEIYVQDAKRFMDGIVKKGKPSDNVYVLLAHSMGGQIALRYMEEYPSDFKLAILSSPLVRLPGGWVTKEEVALKEAFGDLENYIRGNSEGIQRCIATEKSTWKGSFKKTACEALLAPNAAELRDKAEADEYTGDPTNLAASECLVESSRKNDMDPGLAVTCPTVGWLVAAQDSTTSVFKYAATLKMPILMVGAKNDSRVDPDAEAELCALLSNCTIVQIPAVGHELLIEEPKVRKVFLKCFEAFVQDPTRERGGKICQTAVNHIQ